MDEKRDVIFTKSFDCIIDMDVKHGIKRVEIDCNVYMQHTKKSFPDVEELMNGPDVDEICISNIFQFQAVIIKQLMALYIQKTEKLLLTVLFDWSMS